MHEDEQLSTADQVERLLADQAPHLLGPVRPVEEFGTDHCLFRVGDDLVVRMPRASWAVEQAHRDHRWLGELAPHLPVAIPAPVFLGAPGEGYPWPWTIVPWLPGRTPVAPDDTDGLGADLAAFVLALHGIDATHGPRKQTGTRGAPVRDWDDAVRESLASGRELIAARVDPDEVEALWDDMLAAPDWSGSPTWIHGDLLPGNLLVDQGRLAAVIDFGGLGVGDPSADLVPYWVVLGPRQREVFREAVGHDADTWRRARGWAIGPAITGIPYYDGVVPAFVERGLRTLETVIEDARGR